MASPLTNHVSIRQYKSDPISDEELHSIINCGLRASSAGNMQAWSVVVTRDEAMKRKLYEIHREQEMILQAPLVLTFCSDFYRMRKWVALRGGAESFDDLTGFLTGAVDAVIAAQNIAVEAESRGYGICYMGTTLWAADEIAQALKLPDHVVPVTSLVMGKPNEAPDKRDRLPLEAMIHNERYTERTDADILKIYEQREINGWKRVHSWPGMTEKLKAAGITTLAQYYPSDLKYSQELHRETSAKMLALLKTKGFFKQDV